MIMTIIRTKIMWGGLLDAANGQNNCLFCVVFGICAAFMGCNLQMPSHEQITRWIYRGLRNKSMRVDHYLDSRNSHTVKKHVIFVQEKRDSTSNPIWYDHICH
jgi:hypothetical protein